MSNIAVINLGGTQHIVKAGDKIEVNRLAQEAGDSITPEILLSTKGDDVLFNEGKIETKVLEHKKGEKLYIIKFKAKSRYRRRTGHRQHLTVLEVLSINGEKKSEKKASTEKSEKTVATKSEAKKEVKEKKPKTTKTVAKGEKKTTKATTKKVTKK